MRETPEMKSRYRRITRSFLLRFTSILLTAVPVTLLAAPADIPNVAHYEKNEGHQRVIVFVHGLYGNAKESWLCKPDHYWPRMLTSDPVFIDSDVYVAGYETPKRGNSLSIDDTVTDLYTRLEDQKVFTSHKEVIFLVHSLGGLIVQRLLLTHRELQKQVSFIYFFATPQTGSKAADLASRFTHDPYVAELKTGDSNFFLPSIETDWLHANFASTRRFCAYETKKERHFKVVDRLSATRNCEDPVAIAGADHSDIVKPCSTDSLSYIAFRNKFQSTHLEVSASAVEIPGTVLQQQNNFGGNNIQVGNLYANPPGRRLNPEQITRIENGLKAIPSGKLLVVAMLPITEEMREFMAAIRYATQKGGWTQSGVSMDTSTEVYAYFSGPGKKITNAPQGTHCVVDPPKDPKDTRATDYIRILTSAGVNCSSGERGYYPSTDKATVSIFVGVNTE